MSASGVSPRLTRSTAAAAAAGASPLSSAASPAGSPLAESGRKRRREAITLEYEATGAVTTPKEATSGASGAAASSAAKRARVKEESKGYEGDDVSLGRSGKAAAAGAAGPAIEVPPTVEVAGAPAVVSRFFGAGAGSASTDDKKAVLTGPGAAAPASPARPPHVVPATAATASPGRRMPTHDLSLMATASPPPLSSAQGGATGGAGEGGSSSSASAASQLLRVPSPFWREHHANVLAMRAKRDAPVDSMGCERCADPDAPPPVRRFHTLVGLMLSSQTKDEVTFAATKRLIAETGCTPAALVAMDEAAIDALISSVGFHRNKARFLRASSAMLLEKYGGDIPPTLEGLLELPGVGPKMATIAMAAAWGRPVGIGVDVHVHRVANRMGWVKTGTKTPDDTRQALQEFIPCELWGSLNVDLVGFGQQVCTPINPSCHVCLNAAICPVGAKLRSADAWRGGKK